MKVDIDKIALFILMNTLKSINVSFYTVSFEKRGYCDSPQFIIMNIVL